MSQNVLLVGAGALGSRHLQSLAASAEFNTVTVLEPNPAARQTAEVRWTEVGDSANKVLTFTDFDNIAGPFDAAVIATPSIGRLDVLDRVLALGCRRVLCEKVLFQTERDLGAAVRLVQSRGADVRVNHVYRYADALIALKDIPVDGAMRLTVRIGGDGMGCNLIHYLDLLEYLSGEALVALDVALDPVHASKRGPAFVEFCGSASAVTRNGSKLDLAYIPGTVSSPVISVERDYGTVILDEGTGAVKTTLAGFPVISFVAPRVSALTARILADQKAGQCHLPTLQQSAEANRLMLTRFNEHIHGRHDLDLVCPIT